MAEAIKEAKKGIGRTSPNPCVGAVIVQDGEIIARGYHEKAGEPHAEINALRMAGNEAQGATMYVTLEPCNHTGKTPPCSQAVAAAGIRRVVVGMKDPNPLVDGTGIGFLQDNGLEVVSGVLEQECVAINRPFIKRVLSGLPLVAMKAGMSLDGKITYQRGQGGRITGQESARQVHRLRNEFDAIMIGCGTALVDNPALTTRDIQGGRDPLRVIVDSRLRISPEARIFHQQSSAETFVFCCRGAGQQNISPLEKAGAKVYQVGADQNDRVQLSEVLKVVAEKGFNSILLEGGATLHGAMLQSQLVDEAYLFMAPLFIGDAGLSVVSGLSSRSKKSCISLDQVSCQQYGEDVCVHGFVNYPEK